MSGIGVSITPPPRVNVIIPTGLPGPKGEPGGSVVIKGTYSGTNIPLPANPVTGDMWIIGTPVPTLAPPRPDSTPSQPGDGMLWDGSVWSNTGVIQGPPGETGSTGPVGPQGSSGIIMSPNPPPVTTVLWADTDEENGGANGVSVFAQNSPVDGVSAPPDFTLLLNFTNTGYGTATALPSGWAYLDSGAKVLVPPGVYSLYFGWNAPDQYWYGKIQGAYQLGTSATPVDINPGAPVLSQDGTTWYGAASGTAVLHNTQGLADSPWFTVRLIHGAAAPASSAVKWQLNVTRLGNLPS